MSEDLKLCPKCHHLKARHIRLKSGKLGRCDKQVQAKQDVQISLCGCDYYLK